MKKNRLALNLLFLFTFLSVSLFINFFHTEDTINGIDDCPACHFLNSSFTTSQINFFYLPPPSITGLLEILYSFNYTSNAIIIPSSRSPPSA